MPRHTVDEDVELGVVGVGLEADPPPQPTQTSARV